MRFQESIKTTFLPIFQSLRSKDLFSSPFFSAALLLAVAVVCYGLMITRLGFYWDSWPMNWIAQTRGGSGLAQYFSTNRPVWGLLYQITTPILGAAPLPWQIFALVWRWLAALAFWGMLRLLWPRQSETALWASLLFIVYPGFQQQSIGFLYSHFYIVMTAFILSLVCSLWAIRHPQRRGLWLALGLVLSAANLLMMEYFFLLELIRPLVIWIAFSAHKAGFKARLRSVMAAWAPYLALFIAAVVWRVFLFPYTTNNYQLKTLDQLSTQPVQAMLALLQRALGEIWISTGQAWIHAVNPAALAALGKATLIKFGAVVLALAGGLFLVGYSLNPEHRPSRKEKLLSFVQMLLLSALGLGLAGWPFWLTDVPFRLDFAYDRFTLPFIFGASLLAAALILALPWKPLRWLAVAGLVALGAGFQIQSGLAFRQDWANQQNFFWQLKWRVPALAQGTTIIANENKVTAFSTDNSLTAPINWIYDPQNSSQTIHYLMVYPTIRVYEGSALKLVPNWPVSEDLLVGTFQGNTSQSITIFYDGSSCLRVVDPVLDRYNPIIPDILRQTALFSDEARIQYPADGQINQPPLPAILGRPPADSWCQVFENAETLRQSARWYDIIKLWQDKHNLYDQSMFAGEISPFIEAYAQTGQWEQAAQMTVNDTRSRAVFCALWQELDQTAPPSAAKTQAVHSTMDSLSCSEYGIQP
jgi:hypothetical protein